MKILFVIDSLGAGGSERSLIEMLPWLVDRGVRPLIAYFDHREELRAEITACGLPIQHLKGGVSARIRSLRRLAKQFKPDLVHTTLFRSNQMSRLALVGTRVPLLTSLVNTSYCQARFEDPLVKGHKLRIVRAADRLTSRYLTDHFHAVSVTVRDHALEALGLAPQRVTVIPRGRDASKLGSPSPDRKRAARERLEISPCAPVVVTVGRQVFQKGHDCLLTAAAHLSVNHPKLLLLLAGRRGSASDRLEAMAAENPLGNRIRFLGHRDDVPEILAAADVFALPSLFEGFPGAALEAMALGLPIAGSEIGPLVEMLGPGCTDSLVKPSDAAALASVLDRFLSDPETASEAGRRNRARFLDEFVIERSAAQMLDLYRGLAVSPTPRLSPTAVEPEQS